MLEVIAAVCFFMCIFSIQVLAILIYFAPTINEDIEESPWRID